MGVYEFRLWVGLRMTEDSIHKQGDHRQNKGNDTLAVFYFHCVVEKSVQCLCTFLSVSSFVLSEALLKEIWDFTDQMAVASFPCENIKVSSLEIEFMINSKYKCIDHPVSMPQNINNQKWISLTDLQWITWIITCKTCSWLYFCNFTSRYFLDKKYLTDLILNLQLWPCFGCAKWMHLHIGEGLDLCSWAIYF